jgi:tetratricopeptide (TPR) repeat protein
MCLWDMFIGVIHYGNRVRNMSSENKNAGQLNNEGILFYNNAQFEEALKLYNEALKEDPNFLEAWNNKGNVLRAMGRYDESLEAFDSGIAVDPENPNHMLTKVRSIMKLSCFLKQLNVLIMQ